MSNAGKVKWVLISHWIIFLSRKRSFTQNSICLSNFENQMIDKVAHLPSFELYLFFHCYFLV